MGRFKVEQADLIKASKGFTVRKIYDDHVRSLLESFMRVGSTNTAVTAVLVDYEGDVAAEAMEDMLKHGVTLIEGAHTTRAVAKLRVTFSSNPIWKTFSCEFLKCTSDEADRAMMRNIGALSNSKSSKTWDFEQKMIYLHNTVFDECRMRKVRQLTPRQLANLKNEIAYATSTNPHTLGLMWSSAACRTGKAWDYIEMALTGEPVNKDFTIAKGVKKLSSTTYFQCCGPLSDDSLVNILHGYLTGLYPATQIQREAIRLRCVELIKSEIFLKLKLTAEFAIESFEHLCELMPEC